MSTTTDFPRWIMGGPGERSTAIVPTLLREVAPNLYVGSENATGYMPVTWRTHGALVQLSSSCAPVGEIPTYRWTFNDGGPVPGALLDDVVRFVSQWRAKGPVLVQCQAGLSRSASVAYGLLRVLDGLDHAEAERRITTREEHYDRPLVWPRRPTLESVVAWAEARGASRPSVPALVTVEEAERQALQAALNAADGSVLRAAKLAGIGRTTMYRKLSEHGLVRPKGGA